MHSRQESLVLFYVVLFYNGECYNILYNEESNGKVKQFGGLGGDTSVQ